MRHNLVQCMSPVKAEVECDDVAREVSETRISLLVHVALNLLLAEAGRLSSLPELSNPNGVVDVLG